MKKYTHLREKARVLRQRGATVTEISEQLSLGKTTVYNWIRDLDIPRTSRQSAQLRRASQAMQAKYEKQRTQWYAEAQAEAPRLLDDQLIRDFVILYVAEGYKRGRNQVEICNSNADIMRLANACLCRLAPDNQLHYRLQCHIDNNEATLKRYWAEILGIAPEVIKVMRKSNAGALSGRKWRSQYGVLTIQVSNTRLRCQLQAWMDYIADQWHNSQPIGA